MSQSEDQYLESLRKRYAKARKKERGQILDEYVQTTGYHRKYAILVLRRKRSRKTQPAQRPRASVYTAEDARALEQVSDLFEGINAKLLQVALDNELKHLDASGFLSISRACYEQLKHISPATIDRLRQRYGRGLPPRVKRGHTKPETLLKSQILVRTWAEWDEDRPGFTEMDLVTHDGGDGSGDFAHTLDVTDIKTGWTECAASAADHACERNAAAPRHTPPAPVGFSKTALLSTWLQQLPTSTHAAWITLDEGDNDLACFLAYLCSALDRSTGCLACAAPGSAR